MRLHVLLYVSVLGAIGSKATPINASTTPLEGVPLSNLNRQAGMLDRDDMLTSLRSDFGQSLTSLNSSSNKLTNFDFTTAGFTAHGVYSPQLLPTDYSHGLVSQYLESFTKQKVVINELERNVPSEIAYEAYWRSVKVQFHTFGSGEPWHWWDVTLALRVIQNYCEDQGINTHPISVEMQMPSVQLLRLSVTVEETQDVMFPIRGTTAKSGSLLGSFYPRNYVHHDTYRSLISAALRWAESRPRGSVLRKLDMQIFNARPFALTTIIGSNNQPENFHVTLDEYKDFLRGLSQYVEQEKSSGATALKVFLVRGASICGSFEISGGYYQTRNSDGQGSLESGEVGRVSILDKDGRKDVGSTVTEVAEAVS